MITAADAFRAAAVCMRFYFVTDAEGVAEEKVKYNWFVSFIVGKGCSIRLVLEESGKTEKEIV